MITASFGRTAGAACDHGTRTVASATAMAIFRADAFTWVSGPGPRDVRADVRLHTSDFRILHQQQRVELVVGGVERRDDRRGTLRIVTLLPQIQFDRQLEASAFAVD